MLFRSFNQMNEEVEKNIRETGKFADADVKAFSSQLEQEASKYIGETEKNVPKKKFKIKINPAQAKKKTKAKSKGTGKGVGSLEQKVEKAIGRVSEGLEEAERIAGKMIILNRNLKKVDGSASEDSYTQELKRIAREKAIYS